MQIKSVLAVAALVIAPCAASAAPPVLTASQCAALAGQTIPAAKIGLPTSGARITKATLVAASQATAQPAYCLVAGEIAPVDRSAPNIEFNLGLPAAWNGKAFMVGGAGYNGVIPDVTKTPATADSGPLARGYAVFSSDSGHKATAPLAIPDASFAGNAEALANFQGESLKKTRDVALVLIRRAYGHAPNRTYFSGSSGGGREALQAIARWPADWDGAISIYPARNGSQLVLQGLRMGQLLAAPGAYPSPEQRAALYDAALERCDGLDGVEDGVISNVKGCHSVFDPTKATRRGEPLRCPSGIAAGPSCLSDAQLAALAEIDRSYALPFTLATGDKVLPGFNVYTADTGRPALSRAQGQTTFFAFGTTPPANPASQDGPYVMLLADQAFKHVIARDAGFDPLTFDMAHLDAFAARIQELSKVEALDLDLSGFAKRGGKLLMFQGTDDFEVSARATEDYYEQLRQRLGAAAADRVIRFYEVPGYAHTVSAIFNARWDPIAALEAWVEHGRDPGETLTVSDTTGKPGRSRPLCRYPKWPRYVSGDVNAAASFACAAP